MIFVALYSLEANRLLVCRMIEGIGLQHIDYAPIMVPVLLALLQDATPAVARRAVTSGSNIFRVVLEQVALQVQVGSCLHCVIV